jgi:chitin synthase
MESAFHNSSQRPRNESNTLLMLPAPLGRPPTSSSGGISRSSEDNYLSDASNQRLIPSPSSPDDIYEAPTPRYPVGNASFESQVSRTAGNTGAVLRNPTMSSQYPGETPNPFTSGHEDQHAAYSTEPEEYASSPTSTAPLTHRQQQARGVSLSDRGPVPGPEGGVRRVSRPMGKTVRPTSQTPPNQNRYSRSSSYNLPPGAAPPQPSGFNGGYN